MFLKDFTIASWRRAWPKHKHQQVHSNGNHPGLWDLRGRKREEQGGWWKTGRPVTTPWTQPLPQAGSQNFLNWGPEGQPGRDQVYCVSVCLSGPLSPVPASSHSLLQCPPPSSLGRGLRERCRQLWHFLPQGKLLQRSRKGLELRWGGERGNAGRVPGC